MTTFSVYEPAQAVLVAFSCISLLLPTLAVVLRITARRIANRSLDNSDYCIIASAVFGAAFQVTILLSVFKCGLGYHANDIVAEHGMEPVTKLLQLTIAIELLWAISLAFCKISLCMLYPKVFVVSWVVIAARITAAVVSVWCIAVILSTLLVCQPIEYNWDTSVTGGHCGNQVLMFKITGCFNLITDLAVLALPLPCLYNLQLPRYRKAVLMIVFSLGFVTCIITLCRLVFLLEVDYSDLTYNSVKAFIFTTLEPSLAVTLACVPLLRPLLNRCRYSKTGTARFASATGRSSGARQCNRQDDSFDPLDDASDIQLRDSCQKGLETPPEPAESETPRRYLKKDRAQFKVV